MLRETMEALAATLEPKILPRMHRPIMVDVRQVRRPHPHINVEYFPTLQDGQEARLSRRYRDQVDRRLQRRP